MLGDRRMDVLRAIVTEFVQTNEPVGSKSLVERHYLDVSAATVRNDMAVLGDEGYLTQPHTSAGRIPTDKGYRLFVDKLAEVKPLSIAERRAFHQFLQGAVDVDDLVTRTVRLLAQVTQQVALVQYPVSTAFVIRQVDLISLSTHRVLLIVITSDGRVEKRIIELVNHTGAELSELIEKINRILFGLGPREAIEQLNRVEGASVRMNVVIAAILEVLAVESPTKVVVGGVTNLTKFTSDYQRTIRPVLEALEEQVVLLKLLGEVVALNPSDVSVTIGSEHSNEDLRTTSVVASEYGSTPETRASLGVVGPTRMDYPTNIAAVRAVAQYVSQYLAEG